MTVSALYPGQHISLVSLTRDDSTRPAYLARSRARAADSILARVAQGDPLATRECINQYGSLIWSIARRLTRNQADAQEAVREIFNEIWRSASRFDPAQGAEPIFVATIARRRLIDRTRHAAHTTAADSKDLRALSWLNASYNADVCAEAQAAAHAVMQLRPELQRVLELGILHGLSHADIARVMGVPVRTVKTMMCRGLIQVRELMSQR